MYRPLLLLLSLSGLGISAEPEPLPAYSGSSFQRALRRRVSVSWTNTAKNVFRQHTVRHVAGQATKAWRVAVLLDRRIDPSRELELVVRNESVRVVLARMAEQVQAGTSTVGSTVYVGPPRGASRLKTLAVLSQERLIQLSTTVEGTSRRRDLQRRSRVRIEHLGEPRRVLEQIARRWKFKIDGLDRVPHDLWAAADLTSVTAAEALLLVLIQYDLTFEWSQDMQKITIVPIPAEVSLTKVFRSRKGQSAEKAAALIGKELPGTRVAVLTKGAVRVTGTWEELKVAAALVELGRRPDSRMKPTRPVPLVRRRFTLKVGRARLVAIMKQLEQTGIVFEFDAKELAAAGIRLDQGVAVDVRQATAAVLFSQLFEPVGLEFAIEGLKVRLRPKRR